MDHHLLLGAIAVQAELIDPEQFTAALADWSAGKDTSFAQLLLDRGWITEADREHLDYLLEVRLRKHGGDAGAGLASLAANRVTLALQALPSTGFATPPPPAETPVHPATASRAPAPLLSADPARRYARSHLHATGGIGQVWVAHDEAIGRDVALKELRPETADQPGLDARFVEEARVTGRLEHPGIVPVYELAARPGDRQPFYTMRFVKGRTLSEAVRDYHERRRRGTADALELPRLVNAFVTVCNTVAFAHARGVLHRDLKGANVLLGDFGEVILLDWGLAKQLREGGNGEPSPASKLLGGAPDQTQVGQLLGTPSYMAPEQAAGRTDQLDRRTDVYGLGAILYELLTSRPPVERGPWEVMLERVRTQDPVAPRRLHPALSRDLEAVCLKCLEKDPRQRYPSAGALADDLRRWLEGRPTVARPLSWAGRVGRAARRHPFAAAAVLLLLIAAAAVPVAAHYLDPDRVPKDNAKQLGRGRRVTLIGETGPPRWVKHVMGSPAVEDPPAHDGTFAIRSGRTAYLELLPAAPAGGYRFRVKVRHEASDRTGEVGIYFARREVTTARGAEHALGVLRFNDRYAGEVGPDGNRCEFLALEVRRCRTPDHFEATAPPVAVEPFTPAVLTRRPGEPPPWRELAVEVAPEEVRVLWEGRKVATVPRQRLADLFREELNGPDLPGLHEPTWSPSFAPAGGLGLVLGNGWASWKGAEVEPLDASAP